MPKASSTGFSRSCELVLPAGRGHLQHPAGAVGDGLAIPVVSLGQHNGFKLRHRPVQDVVDQNITVFAIILNFLAGFAQAAVELRLMHHTLGAAAIAQAGAQHLWGWAAGRRCLPLRAWLCAPGPRPAHRCRAAGRVPARRASSSECRAVP